MKTSDIQNALRRGELSPKSVAQALLDFTHLAHPDPDELARHRSRLIRQIESLRMEMAKHRRRLNGAGSVFQLPEGNWCGFVGVGKTLDGKRKRKKFRGKTKEAVLRKMESFIDVVSDERPLSAYSLAQLEKLCCSLEDEMKMFRKKKSGGTSRNRTDE